MSSTSSSTDFFISSVRLEVMARCLISSSTFCDGGMKAMLVAAMTPMIAMEVSFLEKGRGIDSGDRSTIVLAACFFCSS